MEKTRTLPPLVRGRVTGVLDFYVEEISLRNTTLPKDNFDLITQVQWWGEDSPTFVRPKKACHQQGRNNKNSDSVGMYLQSVRYEIKTALELFKSYLRTSEVLELCVLNAFEKCIIGEEIGEMVVNFSFMNKPLEYGEEKHEYITFTDKNKDIWELNSQDLYKLNKSKEKYSSYFAPFKQNYFYDKHELINNEEFFKDFQLSKENIIPKENERIVYVNQINDETTNKVSLNPQNMSLTNVKGENKTYLYKHLPEITSSKDSSKILYYGLNSQKSRHKTDKNPKNGVTNKFSSNSIKFKSKKAEKLNSFPFYNSEHDGKKVQKKPSQMVSKNWQENPTKLKDEEKCKVSLVDKSVQSEKHPSYYQTPVADASSKESPKTKVLDYLLGSDLSKEDEEHAVNEFKKMSPSHNLVTSISKLCLTSDSDSFKSGHKYPTNSIESFQPTLLNFNLDNPIERNYYEKFFLKSKPSLDLELAEFLNLPENCHALEKLKSNKSTRNKGFSQSSSSKSTELSSFEMESQKLKNKESCDALEKLKSVEDTRNKGFSQSSSSKNNKFSVFEKEPQKLKSKENYPEHFNSLDDKTKGCAQCKYYKKLEELDTIIESLKHFEKKMLLHEKDMKSALAENASVLSEKYNLKSS